MNAPGRAVLVTGATTPVGRAVVAHLVPHVSVLCVRASGEASSDGASVSGPNVVRHVAVDLARARDVRSLLCGSARDLGVDTIVYVTGPTPDVRVLRNLLDVAEDQPDLGAFVVQSSAAVYRIESGRELLSENHPLDFTSRATARGGGLLEADVLASVRVGVSRLKVAVLRMAEVFAPDVGSALWSFLNTRVCARPLGYDPMLNVLSVDDAARALSLAALRQARGIFNVQGADTLPLSELMHRCGRIGLALPGPVLAALYAARGNVRLSGFDYAAMGARLHYSGIVDGRAAQSAFDYAPTHPIAFEHLLTAPHRP